MQIGTWEIELVISTSENIKFEVSASISQKVLVRRMRGGYFILNTEVSFEDKLPSPHLPYQHFRMKYMNKANFGG